MISASLNSVVSASKDAAGRTDFVQPVYHRPRSNSLCLSRMSVRYRPRLCRKDDGPELVLGPESVSVVFLADERADALHRLTGSFSTPVHLVTCTGLGPF